MINPLDPLARQRMVQRMKHLIPALALLLSIGSCSRAAESPAAPANIEQAERHLAGGAQLVDVRTKEEWDEGHLEGAALATVTEEGFIEKAAGMLDPEKPVLVYCQSGKRSAVAARKLRAAGFTVHDLGGGIAAWKAAGKPVVK